MRWLRPQVTLLERIVNQVRFVDRCWVWQGTRTGAGYGQVTVALKQRTYVHRAMYELVNGPIPDGLEIDHLCSNKPCCRPSHLEAVTRAENMRRAFERGEAVRHLRTHCQRGHEFTPENSTNQTRGRGRSCKTCRRDAERRRRAAR